VCVLSVEPGARHLSGTDNFDAAPILSENLCILDLVPLLIIQSDCVSGFFIDIKSFRSHYGPGVDSASNRNEYQEYLLGVKAAGA